MVKNPPDNASKAGNARSTPGVRKIPWRRAWQPTPVFLTEESHGQRSLAVQSAAAKSLQSCPTLCDPVDISLPGSSALRILQARTLEWVAISFSNAWKWKVKVKSLSHVRLFATPWTAAYQAPASIGVSRQEYWNEKYSLWGHKELDMTEPLNTHTHTHSWFSVSCVSFRCTAKWVIYIYMFRFFSHIGYYRILSRIPCTIQ